MSKPKNTDSPQEQTPKQKMLELLRGSESVVIATSSQPSLDELAAAKALMLILSKSDKKVSAIVGDKLPLGSDLLKPKNVFVESLDGVRDFVIELDTTSTKPDKFRYNNEEGKLQIFITPFNGSYTHDDISSTQGDFNVDALITLGTLTKDDITETVRSHDELLQKAKVVAINTGSTASGFGAIKWHENEASSLSEMMVSVSEALGAGLDQDIAETLLTGIISETEKFTNEKTTPKVMTMSAQLMAAGADQHKLIVDLDMQLSKGVEKPAEIAQPEAQAPVEPKVEPTSEPQLEEEDLVEANTDIKLDIDPSETIEELEEEVGRTVEREPNDNLVAVNTTENEPIETTLEEIALDMPTATKTQVESEDTTEAAPTSSLDIPDLSTILQEVDSEQPKPQVDAVANEQTAPEPVQEASTVDTVADEQPLQAPVQEFAQTEDSPVTEQPSTYDSPVRTANVVQPLHTSDQLAAPNFDLPGEGSSAATGVSLSFDTNPQAEMQQNTSDIEPMTFGANNEEINLDEIAVPQAQTPQTTPQAPATIPDTPAITSENDFLAQANQAIDSQIQPQQSADSNQSAIQNGFNSQVSS